MDAPKIRNKHVYYTQDHEWIDFQGSVAYVGICSFKLLGIRQIQQMVFIESSDQINRGEVIATIRYDDYLIHVNMPVNGKIISINELLLSGDENILLRQPEDNGWIALIVPSQFNEGLGLLSPAEYNRLRGAH